MLKVSQIHPIEPAEWNIYLTRKRLSNTRNKRLFLMFLGKEESLITMQLSIKLNIYPRLLLKNKSVF